MGVSRTAPLKRVLRSTLGLKPRRLLVLTGGGTRGAGQVGMLKELDAAGLTFTAIVGTSVGSLNAARYAVEPGPNAIAGLEKLWRSLRTGDIFPLSPLDLLRGITHRPHLFDESALRRMIAGQLPVERIEMTALPLGVTTTELLSGRTVLWREGPLLDVLTASSALPGVYAPVRLPDGKLHIDGGVASAVPSKEAVDIFAPDEVWILDVLGRPTREQHRTARDVLNTAFSHSTNAVAAAELADLDRARALAVHHIQLPADLRSSDATSFKRTDELIRAGRRAALAYLQTL